MHSKCCGIFATARVQLSGSINFLVCVVVMGLYIEVSMYRDSNLLVLVSVWRDYILPVSANLYYYCDIMLCNCLSNAMYSIGQNIKLL